MSASARTSPLLAVAWLGTATVLGCVLLLAARGRRPEVFYGLWIVLNGPAGVLSLWFGYVVLRRFPGHGAGRILFAMGVLQSAHVLTATVADLQLFAAGHTLALVGDHGLVPADLPLSAAVPLLLMNALWVPPAILAVLLIAYFPDGELRMPRLRWVPAVAAAAAALLMTGAAVDAWPTADWAPADPPAAVGVLFVTGGVLTLSVAVAGVASFVLRWRASGLQRRRFEAVGGVLIAVALLAIVTYPWPQVWIPLVHVGIGAFLVTYGVAIARFRLHDLEPVVGKRGVVTVLSALVALAYLLVVVWIGRLVGSRTSDPVLPLLAVAALALLVEPTRRLLGRGVDRLLYGDRTDRAEVLSRLADHGGTVDAATATDVAEMVLSATGAARVEIELAVAGGPATVVGVGAVDGGPSRCRAGVSDGARRLGEIRVYARAAKDLLPATAQLLQDVARLLSVLLENDRLTQVLTEQLAETRASRQRIVQAQDQARRELERDVHDGAQARLIAVKLHLGELHRNLAESDGRELADALGRLADDVDAAIRDLRALARGLHPPVLDQLGFPPGLRAHLRDIALPVTVEQTGNARYPRAVEGAAYFTCVEAVQNAGRHANAAAIRVDISCEPDELEFTVTDDGRGFDPATVVRSGLDGITDRVSALGGVARVRSAPGEGTRVSVSIPTSGSSLPPVRSALGAAQPSLLVADRGEVDQDGANPAMGRGVVRVEPELGQHRGDVLLDGAFGEDELLGDPGVGVTDSDAGEDLQFPRRQP
ncbi:hypothetical protein EXU48_11150 [Occultella glacieicola]|uniref:Histidine kinase/HSP90-like ATPase domain-containing protein n=1 Tax=Occultella glacieicola TaxID=2518684 RepID=A0ABY2E344_9MICO|nr:hypothetical protein EXU48_11150 [Occultella glacieicola]